MQYHRYIQIVPERLLPINIIIQLGCYWLLLLGIKKSPNNLYILCLTSRTTIVSAHIPEEDPCHRARNLCVFSRIQKRSLVLTHRGCDLPHVSLGALSDVTVILGMRQSIEGKGLSNKNVRQNHKLFPYQYISKQGNGGEVLSFQNTLYS